MSDDEVRHAILDLLYKEAKKDPYGGLYADKIQEALKVPISQMEFDASYLEQKRLITRSKLVGPSYWFASITARGTDLIENRQKYKNEFPFMQTTILQIHGDVNAPIIQAVNSQVSFNQQINDAFKQAYIVVQAKADISNVQKAEIINDYLKPLEEELHKDDPDLGKIQRLRKWLGQNANWILPLIATVVIEGTKRAVGG